MSPLELTLLIRAFSEFSPNGDLPHQQAFSVGMYASIADFKAKGIFHADVTASMLVTGRPPLMGRYDHKYLTERGTALVYRISGAASEFYKEA